MVGVETGQVTDEQMSEVDERLADEAAQRANVFGPEQQQAERFHRLGGRILSVTPPIGERVPGLGRLRFPASLGYVTLQREMPPIVRG